VAIRKESAGKVMHKNNIDAAVLKFGRGYFCRRLAYRKGTPTDLHLSSSMHYYYE
jgi:hypothetical protein